MAHPVEKPLPPMPRMKRGLPATPFDRLQALALAVVAQGVLDDDADLIVGQDEKWFDALLTTCGMDEVSIWRFKLLFCCGLIDARRFRTTTLHAARCEGAPEDPSFWDSWKALPR